MKKLTWYHELGFFNNPFSTKPASFQTELMGFDDVAKSINKEIHENNMVMLSGDYGTGKTTLLKSIINEFAGKRQVIYYNCDQSEDEIDFRKLLINANNILLRLFRVKKKNMILLLDEMQEMSKKDMEQAKSFFDDGYFKSILFVSKNPKITFPTNLSEAIGIKRHFVKNLDKNAAIKLIRSRIGDLKFISDASITKIFRKDDNPRSFLKKVEDVCRFAFENGSSKVSENHIKILMRLNKLP